MKERKKTLSTATSQAMGDFQKKINIRASIPSRAKESALIRAKLYGEYTDCDARR